MNRRLTLKRENLAELTTAEMAAVAGAQDFASIPCLTGVYPTIDRPCPTVQECFEIRQTPLCPTEV